MVIVCGCGHLFVGVVYLLLVVGPVFLEHPQSVPDAVVGVAVTLGCRADGNPRPNIEWAGGDARLCTNISINTAVGANEISSVLAITYLPGADGDYYPTCSGPYRCIASNSLSALVSVTSNEATITSRCKL